MVMNEIQSQFYFLPKKQLFIISKELLSKSFPVGNPYLRGTLSYDDSFSLLENICKYFDISVNDIDVQFFSKFLEINSNKLDELINKNPKNKSEIIDSLILPIAENYGFEYDLIGSCTYFHNYIDTIPSYDISFVKRSLKVLEKDGNWDPYDGRQTGERYDDFQENGTFINDVFKEKRIRESKILDKIVVENTNDVISSLDKETLLELRRIIDDKLRSL